MTKTDSLAEKTGVVVFARILTSVVELLTAIVLVRLLVTTDWAVASLLITIYETAKYLATLGFPDSIFYFFERLTGKARTAFAYQTCLLMGATGLLAALAMLGFNYLMPFLLSNWQPENVAAAQSLLPVMAAIAVLEIPTWPVQNIMLATDRQRSAAWYQLLNSGLTFSALIIPPALGYPLAWAIYGLFGYSVIRLAVSTIWMLKILPPEGGLIFDREVLREQTRFSVPIGLSSLIGRLNKYADKYIVAYFLSEADLAIYNVGAQEIPVIRVIPFAVGSVLISRYVSLQLEDKKAELLDLWYRGIEKVSLIVVPIAFLFMVLADEFVVVLFGSNYEAAAVPFRLYTLVMLVRVTHYGSILQAFNDTRGIMQMSIHLLLWNLALSIPATWLFGYNGTAAAAVTANFINWLVYLRRIGGHMHLPWYKVLPFPYYLKVNAVAALVAIPVWLIKQNVIPMLHTGALAVGGIIYLALFVAAGSVTGLISANDRRQMAGWLRLSFLFKRP